MHLHDLSKTQIIEKQLFENVKEKKGRKVWERVCKPRKRPIKGLKQKRDEKSNEVKEFKKRIMSLKRIEILVSGCVRFRSLTEK